MAKAKKPEAGEGSEEPAVKSVKLLKPWSSPAGFWAEGCVVEVASGLADSLIAEGAAEEA
jgi:hypothetical protein